MHSDVVWYSTVSSPSEKCVMQFTQYGSLTFICIYEFHLSGILDTRLTFFFCLFMGFLHHVVSLFKHFPRIQPDIFGLTFLELAPHLRPSLRGSN